MVRSFLNVKLVTNLEPSVASPGSEDGVHMYLFNVNIAQPTTEVVMSGYRLLLRDV